MGAEARDDGNGPVEVDDPGRAAGGDDVRPLIVGEELWYEARREEFWDFIAERQRIWHNRFERKEPWPWTQDFVLLRQHFSNVYRGLDPTSEWIYRNCVAADESRRDRIFNVLLHRMISRHETSQWVGFWLVDAFDVNTFRVRINEVVNLTDGGLIVAPYFQPYGRRGAGGRHLPSALASVAADLADDWDTRLELITGSNGAGLLFRNLQTFQGFGPFIAYQVFQDLTRVNPIDDVDRHYRLVGDCFWLEAIAPIITRDVEDAIETLTGETRFALQESHIFKLWEEQQGELDRRSFPWTAPAGQDDALQLGDIIACLHNYSRYRRYKNSLRTHRLTFRPPEMRTRRKR